MWLILALVAAAATSLTTIFAKIGIKDVKSDLATVFRTGVVIVCCAVMCLISGSLGQIGSLTYINWIFLVLSGVATGCSWLFYYRAISLGDVNKIAPIDKSSFVLSGLLFMIFFFDDTTRGGDVLTIGMLLLSMTLILLGTLLMIDKKDEESKESRGWLICAILSAVFAGVTSLFVKIGLAGIPSDLGTLIRTVIVFAFAAVICGARGEYKDVSNITRKNLLFLTLSGMATGCAWLCEYYALNMKGVNPVAVGSIGKLSILMTMLFSSLILKEKFTKRSLLGLAVLTVGIIIVAVFSL